MRQVDGDGPEFFKPLGSQRLLALSDQRLGNRRLAVFFQWYGTEVHEDINDKIQVIEKKNGNINIKPYMMEIYPTDEIFILYDNKHTIGIDINQPYLLKGLVSINMFNKFSDVAQACFRL